MVNLKYPLKKDIVRKRKLKKENNNRIILTTRARIARNLSNYRFESTNNIEEKVRILNIVRDTFYSTREFKNYKFFVISKLPKIQRNMLVEKHLISPEMVKRMNGKGVLIDFNSCNFKRSVSILINEEDHLRIQCITNDFDIMGSYNEATKIEKKLERNLNFAYSNDLGYLTACPTNLGTGLRISIIAHLPCLVITSKIEKFIEKIIKIGCSIRGYFGEDSEVIGNLFQISNQISLGKSENEIIEEMTAICLNIIEEENNIKEELKKKKYVNVEDSILRSYGMLKYAKLLSYEEALEFLSMVKLGCDINVIKDIKKFDFYELINIIGDSHIITNLGKSKNDSKNDVEIIRVNLIKEKILKGTD
ncbi:MAG: ATP--guanido phosphotransferase [Actinobacteria bacterium]|nr:ATP--guanido phosphotransferase [Actinomycetota bacterium]